MPGRRASRAFAIGLGAGVATLAAGTVLGWPATESTPMALATFGPLGGVGYYFYLPE